VTDTTAVTWLTQDAYDRLKNEYEYLTGAGQTEIAKKIEAAREEGDLKENGGYHAAKDEQGKMAARARQLRYILENAQVGEAPAADGTVSPGMVVKVDLGGDDMSFLLGNREIACDADIDVYSEKSPLGSAIMGRRIGETATYALPNGKELEVKILDAKPYTS
jgi:transcription elongation factor GreA